MKKKRRHVHPRIYCWHDSVSLDREHYITNRYNKITIDDLIMDYPRQKRHFGKLQLICIVSGSHDAFRSSKVQSGYIHYIRQHQNQEKKSSYSRMFLFCEG